MNTEDLILEELRALRADYNDTARKMGERLATLEESMYSLLGNGRPGRIDSLEDKIDSLDAWKWRVVGIATGISAVGGFVGWLFRH